MQAHGCSQILAASHLLDERLRAYKARHGLKTVHEVMPEHRTAVREVGVHYDQGDERTGTQVLGKGKGVGGTRWTGCWALALTLTHIECLVLLDGAQQH